MTTALPRRAFAPQHPWDRAFFLGFVAACWLGVIMGFAPAVTARFTGHEDYPASLILQVHAIVFPAWLVLLTVQVLLIGLRKPAWHRLLGLTGLAFIPVMVVTGVWSEILSQRHYSPNDPGNQGFFIVPLSYMVVFPLLAGASLWFRRSPATHKRLMLLANAFLVAAAYARWWGEGIMAAVGDGYAGMLLNTYAGFYLLAGAGIAYDLATRRRVHPSYLIVAPLIIAAQIAISVIYHAEEWRPIARWIAGI
jgi:hypothetical protein